MNTLEIIKHTLWEEIIKQQKLLDHLKKEQDRQEQHNLGAGDILQKEIDNTTGYIRGLVKAANLIR